MDWYRWHPTLFEAKTLHLTLAQDGLYRRLIDWYMKIRQPIPDNDQAIANIAKIGIAEWLEHASVIRSFFTSRGGFLHHERCDLELDWQDGKAKIRSEVAIKGAKARWNKNNKIDASSMLGEDASTHARGEEKRKKERIAKAIPKKEACELTDALRTFAQEQGIDDPEREFAACVDWHRGRGTKVKDWPATFRTWCRNFRKFATERSSRANGQRSGAQGGPSLVRSAMAVLAANGRPGLQPDGLHGGGKVNGHAAGGDPVCRPSSHASGESGNSHNRTDPVFVFDQEPVKR